MALFVHICNKNNGTKREIYCLKGRIVVIKSTKLSNKFDVQDVRFAFERGSQKQRER